MAKTRSQPLKSNAAKIAAPIALAAAAIAPSPVVADDIFLKIEGLEGESSNEKHKGEIDVLAWSWNLSNSGTTHQGGGGGGAGTSSVNDIKIVKFTDKATTGLALAVLNGKHFPEATLVVNREGSKEEPFAYLEIEMKSVLVTKLSQGGDVDDNRLTETVALNFAQMCVKYTPQKADGTPDSTLETCWDIAANTEL